MSVANMNATCVDLPDWEQLAFAPATGIAGTCTADDGKRYVYTYFQTSATAAQFWRYDSWGDVWQQLATPATQTGTVANLTFSHQTGGQWSGKTFGAIYLFVGNGTVCYFYKYDIATNTWSANSGTTNVPAAFATDCYVTYPAPDRNNYEGGYHSGVLRTITLSAGPAVGATSLSVNATSEAMPAGTRLRFGTFNVTVTTAAAKGATSLTVSALPQGIGAYTQLTLPSGADICVTVGAAAGATSLSVFPIQKAIAANTVIPVEQFVVTTALAASGATSLSISALMYTISNGSTAPYYGNMYLIGHNATVIYRYNLGANAWYTTSANSGNPALPALPGGAGAGCAIKWLPAFMPSKIWILRGGGTSTTYVYDIDTNTISTETYYPSTETLGAGTSVASRSIAGKNSTLLVQKDATMRVFEGNPFKNTMDPKLMQWKYPTSTAVVGDRSFCLNAVNSDIEYYYILLHSSTAFLRAPLID
jgi:hypothetical protein